MWRYGLWQAGKLIASLIGAMMLAAVLATLSRHAHGFWPMLGTYSDTVWKMIRGNFGHSSVTGHSALADVGAVLPATVQLVLAGLAIALAIGVPLGAVLGASRMLRAAAPLMQIIAAAPVFCAALGLIWLSVHVLHWPAPVAANVLPWASLDEAGAWNGALRAFALPALVVGAAGAACVQLSLQRTATNVANAPYRAGLQMMGLRTLEIDLRYVVPEFAAGLLRAFGQVVLALLAAAAVAEWVFDRDGAAVLFLKSVSFGDWHVVALILLIFAGLKFAADFIGQMAAILLTPPEDAA
jgi:ABC-type dipeptide/oligopeptide/nickel transport system permease component